jgi:hypothetical protein
LPPLEEDESDEEDEDDESDEDDDEPSDVEPLVSFLDSSLPESEPPPRLRP